MTPPGFPNDFPSPTVRHNPCSDPPCQHGTSKRLVGEGLPLSGDEKIRAVLERVARDAVRDIRIDTESLGHDWDASEWELTCKSCLKQWRESGQRQRKGKG